MPQNYLLGIDVGTQGVKSALYDETGACVAAANRASEQHKPEPGAVEEDPELQFSSALSTIRECLESSGVAPNHIAGIGVDGQMAGIIGIGDDGKNVTPYDSWLDTRCGPQITRMQTEAGDEILRKTGNSPSFNHGPKKLWWKSERPEVFARIAKFVQPGGYVAMRLCGLGAEDAFIDSTYLHFSGFADNQNLKWDEGLCRQFDFPGEKLPRIMQPQDIVGRIDGSAAAETGLLEGTPLVAGCGDSAASFLSCGATTSGVCVDIAGTASVFAASTAEFCPDPGQVLGCGRSATPGLWHPYAYINGGGQNLEWFRESLGGGASLEELNAACEKLEARQDLPMFIPHLGGRVSPGWPEIRGSWANLHWDHGVAELYRATLEGVALEYAIYLKTLRGLIPDLNLTEIRVTGGGEKSTVWNQIKADVLQTPIVGIAGSGGAPMGSALLAGFGVGLFDDLGEAAGRWVHLDSPVTPDRSKADHYSTRRRRYEELLDALHSWSKD